jgi:hypothetical protein
MTVLTILSSGAERILGLELVVHERASHENTEFVRSQAGKVPGEACGLAARPCDH